jgi:hypothetical protein
MLPNVLMAQLANKCCWKAGRFKGMRYVDEVFKCAVVVCHIKLPFIVIILVLILHDRLLHTCCLVIVLLCTHMTVVMIQETEIPCAI